MRIGDHKTLNTVLFQLVHALDAVSAPVLDPEIIHGHTLDVAKSCHRNDHIFRLDHIIDRNLIIIDSDGSSSLISVLVADLHDFLTYYAKQNLLICENRFEISDLLHQLIVFILQLFSFQSGQSTQSHVYDSLGLSLGKAKSLHETCLSYTDIFRRPDNPDYFINMIQGDQESLQDVSSFLCFIQFKAGPSGDNFFLML